MARSWQMQSLFIALSQCLLESSIHYLPQLDRLLLADHKDILLQKCCKPGMLPTEEYKPTKCYTVPVASTTHNFSKMFNLIWTTNPVTKYFSPTHLLGRENKKGAKQSGKYGNFLSFLLPQTSPLVCSLFLQIKLTSNKNVVIPCLPTSLPTLCHTAPPITHSRLLLPENWEPQGPLRSPSSFPLPHQHLTTTHSLDQTAHIWRT